MEKKDVHVVKVTSNNRANGGVAIALIEDRYCLTVQVYEKDEPNPRYSHWFCSKEELRKLGDGINYLLGEKC